MAYTTQTEQVKEIVTTWFQNKFENRDDVLLNTVIGLFVLLSQDGIDLLASTNLVSIKEYNLLNQNNSNTPLPIHVGFSTEFTGKPLVISILEDTLLANNHALHNNPTYINIRSLLD